MTIYNGLSLSAAKVFSAAAYPKAILHRQFPFVFGAQQAVEGFRERFLLPETAPPFTEVYGIQHERVFIKAERIVQDKPKTEAGIRNVPFPNSISKELQSITSDDLFPISYNAVSKSLQDVSSAIGFRVSCHILRHTYNTRLEEAGIPGKIRQYVMGHANLDTTENIYTHTQEHYVVSTSDKIREVFDTKSPRFLTSNLTFFQFILPFY